MNGKRKIAKSGKSKKTTTTKKTSNTTTKSNIWSVISNSVEISASDKVSIKAKEISFEADKITRNGVDVDV